MKKSIFLFVLLLLVSLVFAQQDVLLPGKVVEQNSQFNTGKVHYLANAQIKAAGANPQLSDGNGQFTLVFADQPFGNVAHIHVSKKDYDLVNTEELKKAAVMGRKRPLKVVMCKAGTLYENQITYYAIVKDATQKNYEEKLALLEKDGRESRIALAQMQVDFNQEINSVNEAKELLLKQLHTAQQRAKELADKFVMVNLDDESETYQRAFRAFLAKDIKGALAILDSVDLEQRLATNQAAMAKEKELVDTLQGSIARRAQEMAQDVNQCIFKARLYILEYEFKKAEESFELALQYQAGNESLLFEFAYFLQEQNSLKKAGHYYQEALERSRELAKINPEIFLPGLVNTLNNLGALLCDNNKMEEAHIYFQEALNIRRQLADKNSEAFLPGLANSLNNFGNFLSVNNKMEEAQIHYQEALNIRRQLANKNPEAFLPGLANSLNNLGVLLKAKNKIEQAQKYHQEALNIRRQLADKNPEAFLPDVAMTLNNLGILLSDNNEMEEAQSHYQEALILYQELAKKNPDAFSPDIAMTLNNLGILLSDNNEMEEAQIHYQEALILYRELAEKNSDAFLPNVATTLNNLGNLLSDNNGMEEAKSHYQEALILYQELADKNPAAFLPDVAMTLNNLGILLKDNNEMEEAQNHYQKALIIRSDLAKKNPDAFLPDVAMTLNNLGGLLKAKNEVNEAQAHYQEALILYRNLAKKNPKSYNLDVCMTAINLGLFYEELLKSTGEMSLKTLGAALMEDAHKRLAIYPSNYPVVINYQRYIDHLVQFFSNFSEADFLLEQKMVLISDLQAQNETESDVRQRVLRQEEVIGLLNQLLETMPENKKLNNLIASEQGRLAWYCLFDQRFEEAERAARTGLAIDATEEWINTNLALALLYQGQYKQAQALYLHWKDQAYGKATYTQAFLEDLAALEKEGIKHPDVEKIRVLLKGE